MNKWIKFLKSKYNKLNKYIENIEKSLSNYKLINNNTKINIKNLQLKLTENKDLIIGFKNLKTNNNGIEYS